MPCPSGWLIDYGMKAALLGQTDLPTKYSAPFENICQAKSQIKSQTFFKVFVQIRHDGRVRAGRLLIGFLGKKGDTIRRRKNIWTMDNFCHSQSGQSSPRSASDPYRVP